MIENIGDINMDIFRIKKNRGFTVIELLIGLVIMGITTAAAYRLYLTQKKANDVQEQLVEMHQNLRAAMFYLEDEIKTAGCDPSNKAGAGLLQADSTTLQFTRDITGGENDGIDNDQDELVDELQADNVDNDGDGLIDLNDVDELYFTEWYNGSTGEANENITYTLYDAYSDGDMDLGRKSGAGVNQPVAENVDALDFVYLSGNGGVLGPLPLLADNLDNVRSIEVTLVVRSRKPDPDYTDTAAYYNMRGTEILPAQNDHYHRKALSVTVKCRNLGI